MEYLRLQEVLIQLWVFGLGLVFGSFLNVCIYRIPEQISLLWPASTCVSCSKRIVWYDNIPVLSYLFLRGKCRHCQHKISALYPIIEIITGVVFLLLFHSVLMVNGGLISAYIFYLIFSCLLIVGSFVDLKLYIIPNEITYTGLILAPIASFSCTGFHNLNSALQPINSFLAGINDRDFCFWRNDLSLWRYWQADIEKRCNGFW
ncbi:MAG: prepilin peptidase [Planctomycetota bacterium]